MTTWRANLLSAAASAPSPPDDEAEGLKRISVRVSPWLAGNAVNASLYTAATQMRQIRAAEARDILEAESEEYDRAAAPRPLKQSGDTLHFAALESSEGGGIVARIVDWIKKLLRLKKRRNKFGKGGGLHGTN